ncbi:MAG: hypothetical protein A2147_09130 [Chloroflexi bacterium RBG_16_57_8]|nr:MAG: hypothetical protein A2147_09130 [Chloroflexi bacterium RBG_16_57_8]
MTSQIRRACVSIPANIAEGCGRDGNAELSRFLQIALGSATELEYHVLLARDLDMLTAKDHDWLNSQIDEITKMLISLIQKIRQS